MSNPEHVAKLLEGFEVWNEWRTQNPEIRPDLSGANLIEADLYRANLSWAHLYRADLNRANLNRANLSEANLNEAKLVHANLNKAKLKHANLSEAKLFFLTCFSRRKSSRSVPYVRLFSFGAGAVPSSILPSMRDRNTRASCSE